ncbi:MAG: secretin N-terminal domain-containing protein, partial [Planctomycetota bacterium]
MRQRFMTTRHLVLLGLAVGLVTTWLLSLVAKGTREVSRNATNSPRDSATAPLDAPGDSARSGKASLPEKLRLPDRLRLPVSGDDVAGAQSAAGDGRRAASGFGVEKNAPGNSVRPVNHETEGNEAAANAAPTGGNVLRAGGFPAEDSPASGSKAAVEESPPDSVPPTPPTGPTAPVNGPAKGGSRDGQSVQGYATNGVDANRLADELRKRYGKVSQVRIVPEPRTRQVIVMAPPAVQRDVSEWVPRLSAKLKAAGALAPPDDGAETGTSSIVLAANAAVPATPPAARQLTHIGWRELQHGLQMLWGDRLPMQASDDGGSVVVSFPGRWQPAPSMRVDTRQGVVEFDGPNAGRHVVARLVAALDRPANANATDASDQQIVSVRGRDPQRLQSTLAALHTAFQDTANQPAAGAGQAPATAPAAKPTAPPEGKPGSQDGNGAGEEAAGDDADDSGGLIGNVQIEFLEGLDVIVVRGKKKDVERVSKIIQEIEQLTLETKPQVQIYPLTHTNSKALADLLLQVYNQVLQSRQGQVSITGLVKPNALLLIGRTEAVATVVELIQKLDQPVEPNATLKVLRLKHMGAAEAETTIRTFFGQQPIGGGAGGNAAGGAPGGGFGAGGGGQGGGQGGIPGGAQAGGAAAGTNLATRLVIVADVRTSSLIIQASPRDMLEVEKLLEQIDVEEGQATSELRIFKLANTLAQDMANVLQAAIRGAAGGTPAGGAAGGGQGQPGGQGFNQGNQGGGAAANAAAGTARPTNLQFVAVDALQKRVVASGISSDVFITADVSGNSLLVRAPAKSMELLAAIIKELDSLPAAESQIKVFTVSNGDATSLARMLQGLFGQQVTIGQGTGGAFGGGGGAFGAGAFGGIGNLGGPQGGPNAGDSVLVPLRFAVDARTNSIIVSGSSGDLKVVEALLLRLDEGDVPRRRLTVYRLKNALAQDVANSITQLLQQQRQVINQNQFFNQAVAPFEQLEREFLLQAEPQTNSLVVSATPTFYNEIIKMIEQLDYRPPMVMIQVLLAEVQLNNLYEMGIELGLQDSLLYNRGVSGPGSSIPGFNFNNAGSAVNQLPSASGAGRDSLGSQALSNFSMGRTSSAAQFGGLVISAASDSVNILIRALQQSGRLQVLSRPQIMAVHNRQAQVIVGKRVARPQGTTQTTTAVTQNVNDVDVGLILNIIPQINDDGVILMNVQAENSALSDNPTDILEVPSGTGTTQIKAINTTSAVTTISAKDGQTVIFGGLIQTSKTITTRRVPYLSDIPVLGKLFEYNSNSQDRRELMIIMTPKIVKFDEDYDWIKGTESERMNWCLGDVVNVHGDVGLQGGSCLNCENSLPVIYPDQDPTGSKYFYDPNEAVQRSLQGAPAPVKGAELDGGTGGDDGVPSLKPMSPNSSRRDPALGMRPVQPASHSASAPPPGPYGPAPSPTMSTSPTGTSVYGPPTASGPAAGYSPSAGYTPGAANPSGYVPGSGRAVNAGQNVYGSMNGT